MTIDISELSQEKRAFLKANPGLLESLEEAIPGHIRTAQATQEKLDEK
ncbi:unnamed protein product, partial [marine sediment metagenome]